MKTRNLYFVSVALLMFCLAPSGGKGAAGGGLGNPSVGGPASPLDSNGAALVSGVAKMIGPPPKLMAINMAQEPACAKMHGGQTTSEEVETGAGGTLANVVVYISSGLGDRSFQTPSQPVTMDQKGCMYGPHVLALQTSQKLQVVNSDPTSHNIHPLPANNREWNKSQPPGMPPIETSFAREEISIPVKCNVHPWMRSYIAVFKHPYFAVTGKEGRFELRNLPPGSYTVTAWHEKFGTSEQKITVAPNDSKNLEFIFKSKGY
ncbi:MAG TPA: carboxypeptidase regulatory-like domain-containing protein [Acidobacteriota bacterium]|nr:carboxypeptidase regulatory-like domain-containing protein [Acidobacteriota bacterium]